MVIHHIVPTRDANYGRLILIITVILVPSSYPLDVHCSPLGSQTLQMSWKHPEPQHWNGLIQGYVVTYDSIDRGDLMMLILETNCFLRSLALIKYILQKTKRNKRMVQCNMRAK